MTNEAKARATAALAACAGDGSLALQQLAGRVLELEGNCGHPRQSLKTGQKLPCATPGCAKGVGGTWLRFVIWQEGRPVEIDFARHSFGIGGGVYLPRMQGWGVWAEHQTDAPEAVKPEVMKWVRREAETARDAALEEAAQICCSIKECTDPLCAAGRIRALKAAP